jgi:hypothetical protein
MVGLGVWGDYFGKGTGVANLHTFKATSTTIAVDKADMLVPGQIYAANYLIGANLPTFPASFALVRVEHNVACASVFTLKKSLYHFFVFCKDPTKTIF